MNVDKAVRKYLSEQGRKGGLKSKRVLSPESARSMVRIREARRAYRQFHTQCFWSFDPAYKITASDIPWIAKQLREHGGRTGWLLGVKLCP